MHQDSNIIQKNYKTNDRRNFTATRIQKKYRNWKTSTIIPRLWRQLKNKAAFLLQKYLWRYLILMIDRIRMKKFDLDYKHFSEVRDYRERNLKQSLDQFLRHGTRESYKRINQRSQDLFALGQSQSLSRLTTVLKDSI